VNDPETHPPSIAVCLALVALGEMALRDPLTGLRNRRYFDEALADALARAERYDRNLSLALFDLDRFKQLNDRLGHPAGDDALRAFSDLLESETRNADVACRFGGDEFALILPETDLAAARRVAKRIESAARDVCGLSVASGVAERSGGLYLFADADADLLAEKRRRTQAATSARTERAPD